MAGSARHGRRACYSTPSTGANPMAMKPTPLFPLLLTLLLAACGSLRPSAAVPATPVAQAAPDEGDDDAPAPRPDEDEAAAPEVPLTPELLYGIVAAEVAAQRGSGGASVATFMDLARKTRDPRLARRAAELAFYTGQTDAALAALRLWTELNPASDTAREQLFLAYLRTGRLAESLPLVDSLLHNQPARARALFLQLARLSANQPDKAGAYRVVSQLAARFPDLPEAHFALAAIAAETGDEATVNTAFDRLAVLAPQWELPVAWQTDRLRRQSAAVAAAFLRRELDRRPGLSLELQTAYPRLLVSAHRFAEARNAYETLLAANPGVPDLLYGAGLLAFQQQDYPAADRYLQAAIARNHPESDFIRLTLGQMGELRKTPAVARQWYERIGPGPQYVSAQTRLALLDAREGHLEAGMARLSGLGDAASANPQEKSEAVLAQAQIARDAGRYDLAMQVLDNALLSDPEAPELLYERALVADHLGQVEKAEADLRRFLRLKPDDAQGLNALGYILANRTARHAEALALIERALKQEPDSPMVLDSMGWVLFRMGRAQAALPYLERAWRALPDAEVAAHYGEVLWTLGRTDEARRIFDAGAAREAGNPVLTETLRRLIPQ